MALIAGAVFAEAVHFAVILSVTAVAQVHHG